MYLKGIDANSKIKDRNGGEARILIGKTETKWQLIVVDKTETKWRLIVDKGNNKITELRTILQRESQNS
jgi:Holliday junction resolvase